MAIPLMVVCYYLPQPISTVGAAVVFIVAAVTDWFDGWVARRMGCLLYTSDAADE